MDTLKAFALTDDQARPMDVFKAVDDVNGQADDASVNAVSDDALDDALDDTLDDTLDDAKTLPDHLA